MRNINERLDKLRTLIEEPDFLQGKGLSNEVNIRIFCYAAEDEMAVRHFISQIVADQSVTAHLVECDLYKIFISVLKPIDGMFGLDLTRMSGPEAIWKNKGTDFKASWRTNFTWLVGECERLSQCRKSKA